MDGDSVRLGRSLAIVGPAAIAGGGEPVTSIPGPLVLTVESVGVRRSLRSSVGGCEAEGQAACENLEEDISVFGEIEMWNLPEIASCC